MAGANRVKGVVSARSNYAHTAKEASKNSYPEGFVREVGVHNPYDAKANWIRFAPLLGKNLPTGVLIADDGHGMTENIYSDDDERNPIDVNGKYPGLNAFIDIGNSTRLEEPGCIGRKGQGSKLAFQADGYLCLVTKADPASEVWTVMKVTDPRKSVLESSKPHFEVFHYTRQEVFQLLCESADPQSGLAAAKDNKDSDSITRCDHIKEKIIVPWLQFKTGTLLIVSGFCNNELKEQLADLDTFQGYIERSISASDQHPDPGSDYCKLAAYLRFNTVLGHPLLVHALEKADFNKKDIDREAAEDNGRGLVPVGHHLNKLDYQLLTKGGSKVTLEKAFSLKKVPLGYPWVPFTKASRKRQKTQVGSRDGDPLTVTIWSNAAFQERHLSSFLYQGKRYYLALDICGKAHRYAYWQMMNRQGGNDQDRGGKKLSDVGGVIAYSDGVYVQTLPNFFKQPGFEDYSPLQAFMYIQHWDLKIMGEFDMQSSRNALSAEAEEVLKNQNFTVHVKNALDHFRTRNGRRNAFEGLVRRVKHMHYAEKQDNAKEWYAKRASEIEGEDALTAQSRLVVKLEGRKPLLYLQSRKNEENSVIMLYGMLQSYMSDEHFDKDLKPLQVWWPAVLSASGAAGIDSFGVDLTYKPSLQFDSMGRKLPLSRLTSIEFKSTFRVPDTAPKDTKSGRCYNHSFILTDQLVCWDMAWNKDHQVGRPNGGIIVPGVEVILHDTYGNSGRLCERVERDEGDGELHTIPECLKGYAFFIKNIRDEKGDLPELPADRRQKKFMRVVALKKLIQVTFGHEGVGFVTWSPPGTSPDCQTAQSQDEETDSEHSAGKAKGKSKSRASSKKAQPRKKKAPAKAARALFPSDDSDTITVAGPSNWQQREPPASLPSPRKRKASSSRSQVQRKAPKVAAADNLRAAKKLPARATRKRVDYYEDSQQEDSDMDVSNKAGSDLHLISIQHMQATNTAPNVLRLVQYSSSDSD